MDVKTKTTWQQDKDHFIHPWTDFSTFKDEGSLILTDGSGITLTDSEGRQFMDGIGGLWCVNIGYGREESKRGVFLIFLPLDITLHLQLQL
jgi:putrescine aminotransferase